MSRDDKVRVFVGGIRESTSKGDLEYEFKRYGALRDTWVARNPPGFAFVEFEDDRDAEVSVFVFFDFVVERMCNEFCHCCWSCSSFICK